MNIALITGASSGLGREFARQVSRDPHVQAVWAVARRDALRGPGAAPAGVPVTACPVRPVPLDLTDPPVPLPAHALRDLLAQGKAHRHPAPRGIVTAAGVIPWQMGRSSTRSPRRSVAGMSDLNNAGGPPWGG